jgi:hypothetical protein
MEYNVAKIDDGTTMHEHKSWFGLRIKKTNNVRVRGVSRVHYGSPLYDGNVTRT